MKKQLPLKRIKDVLSELTQITGFSFAVLSERGDVIECASEPQEAVGDRTREYAQIRCGASELAACGEMWLVLPEEVFLKFEIDEDSSRILYCRTGRDRHDALTMARMAASQIRTVCRTILPEETRADFFFRILNGTTDDRNLMRDVQRLHIRRDSLYLYVIRLSEPPDADILKMIRSLFLPAESGYLVDMDPETAVLLKYSRGLHMDPASYAGMIVDNLQAEAMINVWVGFDRTPYRIEELSAGYRKVCSALRVGRKFLNGVHVFDCDTMGLEGLIDSIPVPAAERFLREVQGDRQIPDFDRETIGTINCLLENNLNISETARRLYIHRNTLLYRLERIEERIGIDVRSFDGAMTFKLVMMLRIHLSTTA